MTLSTGETSKHITILLNGTLTSLKSVIPIGPEIKRPRLLQTPLKRITGLMVGGKEVSHGDESVHRGFS